jgi:hypothetical protein
VSGPAIKLAITTCLRTIQAAPGLTTSQKTKLEAICGKAAKGDRASVRKVAEEVCAEILRGSGGPSTAREQAIAACKSTK